MSSNNTPTGGFATGSGKYAPGVILCDTNRNASTFLTLGVGYMVANITGSSDWELYRFTGGIGGTLTAISGTSGESIGGTHYTSFKVTYDPTTNNWSLYGRDDGGMPGSFADPSTGTLTQIGSTVSDNIYTGLTMSLFGFAYTHNNSASKVGDFDNFTCNVLYPKRTCGGGTFTIDQTGTNSGTNFTSFTNAVNDLNSCGSRTAPITFNVHKGQTFTENVPSITIAQAASSANYILFQPDASTTGYGPIIQSGTGNSSTTSDAIVTIQGTNYITFNGINLQENPANTTNATESEFGYYIINTSATAGAQNNTIENCSVSLNRSDKATIAVYQDIPVTNPWVLMEPMQILAGRLYAVPIASVVEITRITEAEVHRVDNHEVFQLRQQVLTLVRLDRLENSQSCERSKRVFVVVIGAGSRRFGLAVDKLMGEEELVIKALEDQLVTSPLVSGASILGDGTIVLILNIPAVVSHLALIQPVGATA